jgi:hypothetical protein
MEGISLAYLSIYWFLSSCFVFTANVVRMMMDDQWMQQNRLQWSPRGVSRESDHRRLTQFIVTHQKLRLEFQKRYGETISKTISEKKARNMTSSTETKRDPRKKRTFFEI